MPLPTPNPILAWSLAAVLLFWAVGAYNRLMRLRAEIKSAFSALETALTQQVELVRKQLPAPDATQPAPLESDASFWGGLHGAAAQCAASLANARHRPLEPQRIEALSAARDVLAMAWDRAEREDAHDLAGPRLPDTVLARQRQLALQTDSAVALFNVAVSRYNDGIAQFPAMLLAWLFGFRPGLGIEQDESAAVPPRGH